MTVLDADGHVIESYQQMAKYLDEPYRRRPFTFPWYAADGWDRRLIDKFHDTGGTADEWLRAMEISQNKSRLPIAPSSRTSGQLGCASSGALPSWDAK